MFSICSIDKYKNLCNINQKGGVYNDKEEIFNDVSTTMYCCGAPKL